MREILNLKNQDGSKRKATDRASPCQEFEAELYAKIVDFRKNARNISANWIRINARKIFIAKQDENPDRWGNTQFQASWVRKNMKDKKRGKWEREDSGRVCG
jgi:hypothetical protein